MRQTFRQIRFNIPSSDNFWQKNSTGSGGIAGTGFSDARSGKTLHREIDIISDNIPKYSQPSTLKSKKANKMKFAKNSKSNVSRIFLLCLSMSLSSLTTPSLAQPIDGRSVLGGALGGGAGAAVGSAIGGRNGAMLGSAVGAVAGVAIATPQARYRTIYQNEYRQDYGHEDYYQTRNYRHRERQHGHHHHHHDY